MKMLRFTIFNRYPLGALLPINLLQQVGSIAPKSRGITRDGERGVMEYYAFKLPLRLFVDKNLTLNDVRVYACLETFKNKDTGLCCPKIISIAERLQILPNKVTISIKNLTEFKWLERVKSIDKINNKNEYKLLVPVSPETGLTNSPETGLTHIEVGTLPINSTKEQIVSQTANAVEGISSNPPKELPKSSKIRKRKKASVFYGTGSIELQLVKTWVEMMVIVHPNYFYPWKKVLGKDARIRKAQAWCKNIHTLIEQVSEPTLSQIMKIVQSEYKKFRAGDKYAKNCQSPKGLIKDNFEKLTWFMDRIDRTPQQKQENSMVVSQKHAEENNKRIFAEIEAEKAQLISVNAKITEQKRMKTKIEIEADQLHIEQIFKAKKQELYAKLS